MNSFLNDCWERQRQLSRKYALLLDLMIKRDLCPPKYRQKFRILFVDPKGNQKWNLCFSHIDESFNRYRDVLEG